MSKNIVTEKIIPGVFLAITLMVSSCLTTPVGMTTSSTPLENKTITQNLGKAQGSSGAFDILMLFSVDRPDIDEAINEAVRSKRGDALINVRIYQEVGYYLLFSYTTVIVTGEVVKFGEENKAGR